MRETKYVRMVRMVTLALLFGLALTSVIATSNVAFAQEVPGDDPTETPEPPPSTNTPIPPTDTPVPADTNTPVPAATNTPTPTVTSPPEPVPIPEPVTIVLFGTGLAALSAAASRRKKQD